MRRPSITPAAYRRITLAAVIALGIIVVTGAAVRLTNSGLGCPRWPNCSTGSLTPRSKSDYHGMVEFVNRTFTGLISITVIVAVLGSAWRSPRRRDLTVLSWSLVAFVAGEIVLGGVVVLVALNPWAVMMHFLVSPAALAAAIVLHQRAGIPDDGVRGVAIDAVVLRMSRVLLALASLVLITGSVVTNTGPNAGDKTAKRFDFTLLSVARAHGTIVMTFLACILATIWVASRRGVLPRLQRPLTVLLVAVVAQAAVGYIQYFNGVPPLLVGFHVAGAVIVWSATLAFALACWKWPIPAARRSTEQKTTPVRAAG